jgi:hypothetical protein
VDFDAQLAGSLREQATYVDGAAEAQLAPESKASNEKTAVTHLPPQHPHPPVDIAGNLAAGSTATATLVADLASSPPAVVTSTDMVKLPSRTGHN